MIFSARLYIDNHIVNISVDEFNRNPKYDYRNYTIYDKDHFAIKSHVCIEINNGILYLPGINDYKREYPILYCHHFSSKSACDKWVMQYAQAYKEVNKKTPMIYDKNFLLETEEVLEMRLP